MSLGGPKSEVLNSAIASAVRLGMVVCVAAGNSSVCVPISYCPLISVISDIVSQEQEDASTQSPASEVSAITVGSTTKDDELSSFSNFGQGKLMFTSLCNQQP